MEVKIFRIGEETPIYSGIVENLMQLKNTFDFVRKKDKESGIESNYKIENITKLITDDLISFQRERLKNIMIQYGYNGLSDIQFYASQNDQEAKAILNWYQAYDDAIWNWLDNELTNISDLNQLLQLDLKAVEQQIFENSIKTSPLPQNEE